MKLETLAVKSGRQIDSSSGAIIPPLYLSTTFQREPDGDYPRGYIYTRNGNPNRTALESALATLEGGQGAFAFSSGQAAASAIMMCLSAGDHVLMAQDLYHGNRNLVQNVFTRMAIEAEFVDATDPGVVRAAIRPKTALIWVETPSNPLLTIIDIAVLAQLAREHSVLLVVDNTWATPVLQRPLDLGADLVVHSTTKYIGGHSDVLGGCVVFGRPADDPFVERLAGIQVSGGAVPSPFDCWLLLRSLPTLPARVRSQTGAAKALASFLASHRQVEKVYYPGLESHAGHEVAFRQMEDFGAMISFQVRGSGADAMTVAGNLDLIIRATSLGGVESFIEHRASIEGVGTTTPQNLLRFSVGLENVDDLMSDLDQALAKVEAR